MAAGPTCENSGFSLPLWFFRERGQYVTEHPPV